LLAFALYRKVVILPQIKREPRETFRSNNSNEHEICSFDGNEPNFIGNNKNSQAL
jgi:hypothetical protein